MSAFSNELVRGTLKTLVLKIIDEQSRSYGYQVIKEVRERTNEKIILTEGALYPILHQLEKNGLVTIEEVNYSNRIRKYYRLTPSGKEVSDAKTMELLEFMQTMARFIKSNA